MLTKKDIKQFIAEKFTATLIDNASQHAQQIEIGLNQIADIGAALLEADEEIKTSFKRQLKIAAIEAIMDAHQAIKDRLVKIEEATSIK